MAWSVVNFGRFKKNGWTLPQIVFRDPDWFFWAYEEGVFDNKGSLAAQAGDLNHKAQNIRLPTPDHKVQYTIHAPTGKLQDIQLIPDDQPFHDKRLLIPGDRINLNAPRLLADYDKRGCSLMLSDVKYILFGDTGRRMTARRCKDFFDDDANFH